MKNTFRLLALGIVILFYSCQGDDVSIFDKQRANIFGDWIVSNENVFGAAEEFEITFNENGTGNRTSANSDIEIPFTWLYQFNPEQIVIDEESLIMGEYPETEVLHLRITTIYNIVINEPDEQSWTYESTIVFGTSNLAPSKWVLSRP